MPKPSPLSIDDLRGLIEADQVSYSASKGGVLSMLRELGVQLAREGIRVNALCPGPVNTPVLQ